MDGWTDGTKVNYDDNQKSPIHLSHLTHPSQHSRAQAAKQEQKEKKPHISHTRYDYHYLFNQPHTEKKRTQRRRNAFHYDNYKIKIKKYDKRTPQTSGKSKRKKENENTKEKSNDPQQDKHIPVPLEEKTIFPPLVQLFNQSTNRIACLTAFEGGGGNPSLFFLSPPSLFEIHRVLSFIIVFPVCTSVRCLLTFFLVF